MDYYETMIDFDEFMEMLSDGNACLDDIIKYKDIKNRKLFINEEIDSDSVAEAIKQIMRYNSDDRDKAVEDRMPITLYLCSVGGYIDPGFSLIDVILQSKTPVYTVNMGLWYSTAFLIGLSGHKRFAFSHSKFLMHDGWISLENSGSKAKDYMKFSDECNEKIKEYVLERSNIDSEQYDKQTRDEWYMLSEQAKEYGFVDYIIGQDCVLDEVI